MSEEPKKEVPNKEDEDSWTNIIAKTLGVITGICLGVLFIAIGGTDGTGSSYSSEPANEPKEEEKKKKKTWSEMSNKEKFEELRKQNEDLHCENEELKNRMSVMDDDIQSAKSEAESNSGIKVTVVKL